jgi:hypothetical protein
MVRLTEKPLPGPTDPMWNEPPTHFSPRSGRALPPSKTTSPEDKPDASTAVPMPESDKPTEGKDR